MGISCGGKKGFKEEATMTFAELATITASAGAALESCWMNDDYIFMVENGGSQRLLAYEYNADSLTLIATQNLGANGTSVLGTFNYLSDDNMIYVGISTGSVRSYHFTGTAFTGPHDTVACGNIPYKMTSYGTYLYIADGLAGITAMRISGRKLRDTVTDGTPPAVRGVFADANYVYVADATNGLYVYTYNGVAFTQIALLPVVNDTRDVWANGRNVFVCDYVTGVFVYDFDGTNFILLDNIQPGVILQNHYQRMYGDGEYVYILGVQWTGAPETAGTFIYRFANNELTLSEFLSAQFNAVASVYGGALFSSNNKVAHCQADILEVLQGTPEFTGSFSVSPTAGPAPLAVTFTNQVEIF